MKSLIMPLTMLILATAYGYQTIVSDDGRTYTVYGEGERPAGNYLSGTTAKDIEGPEYTAEEENARTSLNNVLNWAYGYDDDESKNHARAIKSRNEQEEKGKAMKKFGVRGNTDSYYVDCYGEGLVNDKKCSPSLRIRYKEGRFELYVNFGVDAFSKGIQFGGQGVGTDKSKFVRDTWSPSTDGQAAFYGGDVVALINKMGKQSFFGVLITGKNGSKCAARFVDLDKKAGGFIGFTNYKRKMGW